MKKRSSFQIMRRLIGLVAPLAPVMVLAILMGVAGFLTAIFITVFGGYALLDALGESVFLPLPVLFACVAVFAVTRGFLRYGEQACNHYIAFKLLALIRDKVFGALRRLAPAKLECRDKGNLISIITSDIELLEVFYAHTISPCCIAVIVSLIMIFFMGALHWALALTAAAAYLAVGVLLPLAVSRRSRNQGESFRAEFGDMNAYFMDNMRGLREIIQYDKGKERLEAVNARSENMSATEARMKNIAGFNSALTGAVVLFFTLFMLLVSASLYTAGQVGFSGVVLSVVAMASSFGPVIAVANLGTGLSQTMAAGNRVLDILDEEPVVKENTDGRDISFNGAALKNVSFSYGEAGGKEAEAILQNVSLEIPKGKIVGIAGRSGSGKSTLLKLLMRFWDTQSGQVLVSEADIRRIRTGSLRKAESFMTQETQLFHDSIENNLRIAKRDATREEITAACKKASVHDFITSLPRGYDTPVGELGSTLSGGERQRLGLARAFLHDAPLLLLDEPTSNLDSLNEAVILKALREEEGKTVVLVSHRPSTMRIADETYSMENGRMS